jgi:hypothetical protein
MAHKKRGSSLHISVSKLSRLSSKDLRALDCLKFIVAWKHTTLAVLIPYDQYCEMQLAAKAVAKEAKGFAMDANFFRGVR